MATIPSSAQQLFQTKLKEIQDDPYKLRRCIAGWPYYEELRDILNTHETSSASSSPTGSPSRMQELLQQQSTLQAEHIEFFKSMHFR